MNQYSYWPYDERQQYQATPYIPPFPPLFPGGQGGGGYAPPPPFLPGQGGGGYAPPPPFPPGQGGGGYAPPPPFPPGQGGQQQGGEPQTPPPAFTPPRPQTAQAGLYAVDPGAIRRCLYRYTYVWLRNGRDFWFYPVYVGRTSVAGYRWRPNQYRWVYVGLDLNSIDYFECSF